MGLTIFFCFTQSSVGKNSGSIVYILGLDSLIQRFYCSMYYESIKFPIRIELEISARVYCALESKLF